MGGMAAGISVLGSNVGGAGSVEGFDVEERVGPWPIKAAEHDVWAVLFTQFAIHSCASALLQAPSQHELP